MLTSTIPHPSPLIQVEISDIEFGIIFVVKNWNSYIITFNYNKI